MADPTPRPLGIDRVQFQRRPGSCTMPRTRGDRSFTQAQGLSISAHAPHARDRASDAQ